MFDFDFKSDFVEETKDVAITYKGKVRIFTIKNPDGDEWTDKINKYTDKAWLRSLIVHAVISPKLELSKVNEMIRFSFPIAEELSTEIVKMKNEADAAIAAEAKIAEKN